MTVVVELVHVVLISNCAFEK